MSYKCYKKRIISGVGCSLLLFSFFSQTASASQMVQFTLKGTLEPMDEVSTQWQPSFDGISFAGASLSGFVDVNLDTHSNLSGYSALYGLDNWSLQITANSGEVVYFNPTGDARESDNLFRLNSLTNVMSFSLKEYGYADVQGADGFLLGVPSLSLNIRLPSNVPIGATLEDVLDGNLSLESSDLSYGYIELGSNNSGYFESASATTSTSVSPVPEPSTLALLALGSFMIFSWARRQPTLRRGQHIVKVKPAVFS